MAQWDLANLVSMVLDTQTDADSPGSQALMDKLRWMLETLYIWGASEGTTGTVDSVSGTTLTDTGAFTTDEHNGRTLLITTGDAKGYIYSITDTTTNTLVCAGESLDTDGVAAADTYRILFDILTNTDGHDHDGVNSKDINVSRIFMIPQEEASITSGTKAELYRGAIYRSAEMTTLDLHFQSKGDGSGSVTVYVDVGAGVSGSDAESSTNYQDNTMSLDISGESTGWLNFIVSGSKAGGGTGGMQGMSGVIT